MKTDIKGVSQCAIGQEQFEMYKSRGKTFVQYDYRNSAGKLFSCIGKTLAACREKRNEWLARGEK